MILPLKIIHPSALLSGGRSNFERMEMKNKAIMVEYEGKQRSITSLAREYGITSGCLYYRLTHGWGVERAVNEPMENGRANTYQYKGKWYNAAELAKLNGEVSPCTMHQRLLSGMSVAEAVETPNRRKHLRKRITEEEPRDFIYTGDHAVYVISKNAANDVMEYYNQQHGMKNAVFRFPTVFGVTPHMSLYVNGEMRKSGFQIFMEKAEKAEDITVFGNPQMIRDVAYVKDVANAFYLALKSENTYGLYNMTAGGGVTLQEQAEVMRDVFGPADGRRSRILYKPEVQNNTPSYLFSMEKAKRDFGFEPKFKTYRLMMEDFKKDWDNNLYRDLFKY